MNQPNRTRRIRTHPGDHGSGALSTVFGLTVFLTLLTFSAHVLLNLWLATSIDSIAHDAAADVAASGATDQELPMVEAQAIARADAALGRAGERVRWSFEPSTPDRVVLHVEAAGMTLVPRPVADALGLGALDRRITVRREPPTEPGGAP